MIYYFDRNDHLNLFDSNYFDNQGNYDPLIEIAIDIAVNGYRGIVVHHQKLTGGKYFFGINFREDTHEGKIFSKVQADFYQGLPIPNSHDVMKKIKRAYRRQVTP